MIGIQAKSMSNFYYQFSRAILAGICIGIGGCINLSIGGIFGGIFFAFGLLVIIYENYNLFTGIARNTYNLSKLLIALFGNIIGCFLVAKLAACCSEKIVTDAITILTTRLNYGIFKCFLLSIPCGFIVTAVVRAAKEKNMYFPIFFGVPIFILCGFPHCIADAFNFLVCPISFLQINLVSVIFTYIVIVLGNYIGCNLYRIVPQK